MSAAPLNEDGWLAEALAESRRIESAYHQVARAQAYRNAWFKFFWPRYCRTCGGWGTSGYQGNQAPLDSGWYWPEAFADPCPDCAEQGHCGRCGGTLPDIEDGEVPCPHCGWQFDDGLQLSL